MITRGTPILGHLHVALPWFLGILKGILHGIPDILLTNNEKLLHGLWLCLKWPCLFGTSKPERIGCTGVFLKTFTPRWLIKHKKNLWLVTVIVFFFSFRTFYSFISGWWLLDLPLWKMMEWKSVGMMTSPIYGGKKHVPNHQPDLSVQWLLAINVETPVFREWRIVWYGWTSTFCWSIPAEFSAVNIHLILTISMVKSSSIFCGAPIADN